MENLPILYSFRRCPYAIRARMALIVSNTHCELREVSLQNKPAAMIAASPKATVPVMVLPDGTVIDESRDIMTYALGRNDPEAWLTDWSDEQERLVVQNDGPFKYQLDRYKYPKTYDQPPEVGRTAGLEILKELDRILFRQRFLVKDTPSLVDVCLFPFVRQFAAVDSSWFQQTPLVHLQNWLAYFVEGPLFRDAMISFPLWEPDQTPAIFPNHHEFSPTD